MLDKKLLLSSRSDYLPGPKRALSPWLRMVALTEIEKAQIVRFLEEAKAPRR